jgi:hypothetical protein
MVSTRHKRQMCLYVAIIVVVFFILYYGVGAFWSSSSTDTPLDEDSASHIAADIL